MILCPIDFSPVTTALIRLAAGLARAESTDLVLLHVEPSENPTSSAAAMAALLTEPALAGLAVRTVVQTGCAARQILHFAAAQAAGLIVLGAHGATGLTRFLVGSTAESVLRGAACPTLLFTVKPTE